MHVAEEHLELGLPVPVGQDDGDLVQGLAGGRFVHPSGEDVLGNEGQCCVFASLMLCAKASQITMHWDHAQ